MKRIKNSAVVFLAGLMLAAASFTARAQDIYLPIAPHTDQQFSTPVHRPPLDTLTDAYSVDIKYQDTEGRAIDYVDTAPRATTTITDVLPADVDMYSYAAIQRGNAWTYSYNTKTIHQKCFNAKMYVKVADKFMTVTGAACYDQLDPNLDADTQYTDVLNLMSSLIDRVHPDRREYMTFDLSQP